MNDINFTNLPQPFKIGQKVLGHKNFNSIQHLSGSKMIDAQDKLIGKQSEDIFINKLRNPKTDKVIITEKIRWKNISY